MRHELYYRTDMADNECVRPVMMMMSLALAARPEQIAKAETRRDPRVVTMRSPAANS
jgi:hypothetical protein